MKILNPGSRDISQKLRQTKCLFFIFWMIRLTKTPLLPNCQVPNGFFGIIVNFSLQILKSIHLVCLSFWDISIDPGFRIFILTHELWAFSWIKVQLITGHVTFKSCYNFAKSNWKQPWMVFECSSSAATQLKWTHYVWHRLCRK